MVLELSIRDVGDRDTTRARWDPPPAVLTGPWCLGRQAILLQTDWCFRACGIGDLERWISGVFALCMVFEHRAGSQLGFK